MRGGRRLRPRSGARRPGRRPSRSRRGRARRRSRRSSWTIVPRIRPPLAPIGWPSATAPPFTFAVSGSAPSICTEFSATDENASFTSTPLHVADRLAGLLQRLRAGVRRRAREPRELVRDVALRDDRRERLEAAPLRELLGADDHARRAVVHARRVARRDRALRIHHRLQRREPLERRVAADRSRRPSPPRPGRSRRRRSRRPAPSRRARASAAPSRPAPRARCRARARRARPAAPCAARRTSSAARPRSSGRRASPSPIL